MVDPPDRPVSRRRPDRQGCPAGPGAAGRRGGRRCRWSAVGARGRSGCARRRIRPPSRSSGCWIGPETDLAEWCSSPGNWARAPGPAASCSRRTTGPRPPSPANMRRPANPKPPFRPPRLARDDAVAEGKTDWMADAGRNFLSDLPRRRPPAGRGARYEKADRLSWATTPVADLARRAGVDRPTRRSSRWTTWCSPPATRATNGDGRPDPGQAVGRKGPIAGRRAAHGAETISAGLHYPARVMDRGDTPDGAMQKLRPPVFYKVKNGFGRSAAPLAARPPGRRAGPAGAGRGRLQADRPARPDDLRPHPLPATPGWGARR